MLFVKARETSNTNHITNGKRYKVLQILGNKDSDYAHIEIIADNKRKRLVYRARFDFVYITKTEYLKETDY